MRKIIFILMLGMAFTCHAQNGSLDIISGLMKKQEQAWSRGDVEGFMKYYWKSDSLKFIGSKGITYGWQKTLDNYKKSYPDKASMGILTFQINTMEELSKTSVFVIGNWNLEREKSIGGYFTLLWKKIEGNWVIVIDHTS